MPLFRIVLGSLRHFHNRQKQILRTGRLRRMLLFLVWLCCKIGQSREKTDLNHLVSVKYFKFFIHFLLENFLYLDKYAACVTSVI